MPGMGDVHQERGRFSLHAKNASLTAQLSNPHQHFLMNTLSGGTAGKYLALVIATHEGKGNNDCNANWIQRKSSKLLFVLLCLEWTQTNIDLIIIYIAVHINQDQLKG